MNHSEIIYEYIKAHPGASIETIAKEVCIIRYIVELVIGKMMERGLVQESGKDQRDDTLYEILQK